jgi:Helix-turn-helix domain
MPVDESPLGDILRAARDAAGWSLARMERATGYSKPYLSRLETGGKEVKAWHIQAYDRALGGDDVQRRALLLMGASIVSTAVWAELDMPVAPPQRVGSGDVAALADSADYLTGLGLRHGGRASVAASRGQLRYAAGMLDLSMSNDIRTGLLLTIARLADRTAWSMVDVGHLAQAHKIYDFSLTVTPDSTQRWLTLVNLADLHLLQDQPTAAWKLLDQSDPDHPVLSFLVHSTRAYAHARLGEFGPTMRHIEHADLAHGRVDVDDLPESIKPYASGHDAHAHATAGKALHALAIAGSKSAIPLAVERLEAAMIAFGSERAHAVASCERRLNTLPG